MHELADAVRTDLSVVIPMHNSATVIEQTIAAWRERLAHGVNEVILVENGSSDDTLMLARTAAVDTDHVRFVILQSPKGMGNALRLGILASQGERVLLSADDLPFGFDDLDGASMLDPVPMIVIGSKAHPESRVERGFARWCFTTGYRLMRLLVLGSRVGDTQGTFIVDGDWVRGVANHLDEGGFLFTTQLVVFAESEGLAIAEVPVRLIPRAAEKPSTVRWSDVMEMGRGLRRLRASERDYAARREAVIHS